MAKILIFILFFFSHIVVSQNILKTIEQLQTKNQKCLDKGLNMYGCSVHYLQQADSMLNVAYRVLRKRMSPEQKLTLKQEQLVWLKQRDLKFTAIDHENIGLGNGLDAMMVKNQEKARYVFKRVAFLANYKIKSPEKISTNLNDFVASNYIINEKHYQDFNKDGRIDCVLLIKDTDPSKFVVNSYGKKVDRNRRGLILLLNTGDQHYKLIFKNERCFSSENEEGGIYFPPELSLSAMNGKLYIHYSHGRYGYWKYQFRFKNNDLELIGYDADYNRGPVLLKRTSINFLSKKKHIQKNTNEDDEGNDEILEDTWSSFQLDKRILLSEIEDFDDLDMIIY